MLCTVIKIKFKQLFTLICCLHESMFLYSKYYLNILNDLHDQITKECVPHKSAVPVIASAHRDIPLLTRQLTLQSVNRGRVKKDL